MGTKVGAGAVPTMKTRPSRGGTPRGGREEIVAGSLRECFENELEQFGGEHDVQFLRRDGEFGTEIAVAHQANECVVRRKWTGRVAQDRIHPTEGADGRPAMSSAIMRPYLDVARCEAFAAIETGADGGPFDLGFVFEAVFVGCSECVFDPLVKTIQDVAADLCLGAARPHRTDERPPPGILSTHFSP